MPPQRITGTRNVGAMVWMRLRRRRDSILGCLRLESVASGQASHRIAIAEAVLRSVLAFPRGRAVVGAPGITGVAADREKLG